MIYYNYYKKKNKKNKVNFFLYEYFIIYFYNKKYENLLFILKKSLDTIYLL